MFNSSSVFSLTSYTPVRTLKTRLYSYKLFRGGANGFLCVSLPSPVENYFSNNTVYRAKLLLEQIN
jgi:hypothetical protein